MLEFLCEFKYHILSAVTTLGLAVYALFRFGPDIGDNHS